jgi:malate permease and related proteins
MGFLDLSFLNILLPLFLLIGGGFVISRLFSLPEGPLVRVVTDFFMPLLIFYSFCTTKISLDTITRLFGAVSLVVAGTLGVTWLFCKAFKLDIRITAPPLLFTNSGFLGIPIMKLWGGLAAMNLVIIYDQIQTFYIFTLGIIIVTGGYKLSGIMEIVRSPLIWAILLGFGFNLTGTEVPGPLLEAFRFGGEAAPALAIFSIGMTLNNYKVRLDLKIVIGVLIRIGLGFLLGLGAAALFGFSGMAAVVIVVASALPSGVFSVVLPVRYGLNGQYAGSVLIITTLLSLFTLPFLFQAAQSVFG